jgi:uncharacterized protein (UPF0212 family)
MKKYEVVLEVEKIYHIEAENEEEAIEIALNKEESYEENFMELPSVEPLQ